MAKSNRQFPSVTMIGLDEGLDARLATSNGYEFLRVTQDSSGGTIIAGKDGVGFHTDEIPEVSIDGNAVLIYAQNQFYPDEEGDDPDVPLEDVEYAFYLNGKKVDTLKHGDTKQGIVIDEGYEGETGEFYCTITLTLPYLIDPSDPHDPDWWLPDYDWVDGETYVFQAAMVRGRNNGSSRKSEPVEYLCRIDTLETPEIEFSENINVITWSAIDFAEKYDILVDGEKVVDVDYDVTEYDLRDLHLVAGLYAISVVATSTVYESSEPSNTLVYEQLNIGTLEETDWSVIKMYSDKGSSFWDIGDTKSVTLNGQMTDREDVPVYNNVTYYVYIIGFNHDNYEGVPSEYRMGITFAGFINNPEDKILISLNGTSTTGQSSQYIYPMNIDANSKYTWKDSNIRNNIIGSTNNSGNDPDGTELTNPKENSLMALIDSDFRSVLSPMYVETYITWDNLNQKEITIDYCKIFAGHEVLSSWNRDEGHTYKFFETNDVYDYKKDSYSSYNVKAWFWLRSTYYMSQYSYHYRYLLIDCSNKAVTGTISDRSCDIVPVFRVAPEQTAS